MRTIALLSLAALSSGLAAQSNTVPGLDGRLTVVNNLTYYGRRGAAYPNGEAGMAMLNTMCNPGSVNIPWYAPMQPNHPMFGFIIARVANDRIEQINEWSYCKHAFTSVNVNGSCGTCQNPGTGQLMGINCSDTYGAGNNASRTYLGPPEEINPWTAAWNPVGSYFDIGDPAQPGYPATADGVRSLSQSIFDSVDNRVTVDEIDLVTPGASYYYGIQLLHQGEAVANRHDNLAHRGFNPSWNGSSWSFANNAEGQEYDSILNRWPGASVDNGRNTNDDDGRIFVAVKTTSLGGGNFHYEYAVHNVDYSRAAGTFRLPIDPSATASNFTFGDIDTNGANDWTGAQVGNEVVFTAPAGNPVEWNTIYNFGFDANFAPGLGLSSFDAARPVLGEQNFVEVPTQVPAGGTFATKATYGTGCGGTTVVCDEAVYEAGAFDLANSAFTLDYDGGADKYTLTSGGAWIAPAGAALPLSDDDTEIVNLPFTIAYPGGSTNALTVCSNGFISDGSNGTGYNFSVSSFLSGNPMWSLVWRDLNPAGSGSGDVVVDATAARVVISWDNVNFYSPSSSKVNAQAQFWANGDVVFAYQGVASTNALVGFSLGGGATDPGQTDLSANLNAGIEVCDASGTPDVAHDAATRPVIGTSISLDVTNGSTNAAAGLIIFGFQQVAVDVTFLGLTGCTLYTTLDDIQVYPMFGGNGSFVWPIPNNSAFSGITIYTQMVVPDMSYNPFGAALSNGLSLTLGIN